MADPDRTGDDDPTSDDSLGVADVRPGEGDLARAVVRAQAAAALFGVAAAVTVGRYRVLARVGGGGGGEVWSAWDPELDRRVALKLIDTASSASVRERVRAEGQALARLSHPNVVPVHDVIDHGDHVVLVMEYVDGSSLRAWAARDRSPREVVRAYRQLADGLAALHAAGLIHRDVKPDNAVVGSDGRVRVVDLGLAVAADRDAVAPGTVAGTPRYMAPEQAAGRPVTAAADQYGLCSSLREALTDGGGAVPAWLTPVLDRGCAADPDARFPSMAELAAALSADPARRRRLIALAAAGLGAVGLAFAIGRSAGDVVVRPATATCDGQAALARVWNDAARASVRDRLAGHATPYSAAAGPSLLATFDGYGAAWADGFDRACRLRAAGEVSPTLAERRAGCLAAARAALGELVTLAAGAGPDDVSDVAQAAAALPSVERCADDAALLADVAPPPPAIAGPAAELADRLAAVRVHVDAARADAVERADAALAAARALGHPPLVARALVLDGRARRGDGDHGAARFAEAVDVALAARDDALAVEAFARQLWAAATAATATPVPGGAALADQLAARLPDGRFARALLGNNRGVAALARGDRDAARTAFTGAVDQAAGLSGPDAVELLVVYANLALVTDDDDGRDRLLAELLVRRTAALGAAHPRTLDVAITRGMLAGDPGRAAALLGQACADLARYHPAAASDLADCWYELALVRELTADLPGARAALDRAAVSEGPGRGPPRTRLARAHADRLAGRLREALAGFEALHARLADGDDRWWIVVQRAEARLGRAQTLAALGRRGAALADARAAATALDEVDQHQRLAWVARRAAAARALADQLTSRSGSPR